MRKEGGKLRRWGDEGGMKEERKRGEKRGEEGR